MTHNSQSEVGSPELASAVKLTGRSYRTVKIRFGVGTHSGLTNC